MSKLRKIKYLLLFTTALLTISAHAQGGARFKVALDAGHGAHDFGATYHGHIEKNIALAVVLKVGKILEKNPNIDVIYTRKTDVFIDLVERANIANRADANIFVSIHCNANKNTVADGSETYVMGLNKNASNLAVAKAENAVITLEKDYKQKYEGFDPNNPGSMIGVQLMQEEYLDNSISLASRIQDRFVTDNSRKSRGVKQAPFMVLHKAYMPRVLIEMGFISNPVEGAFLDSEDGQNETAQAIANAIISYKKEYFGNGDNEPAEEKPSKKIKETPTVTPTETVADTPKKPEPKPETKPEPAGGVLFKVQLAAASRQIETTPSNFKGLRGVSVTTENGSMYKYMYGDTSDYETARQNLAEAKAKGYTGAYLVAFRDGKKISLQEAIK